VVILWQIKPADVPRAPVKAPASASFACQKGSSNPNSSQNQNKRENVSNWYHTFLH